MTDTIDVAALGWQIADEQWLDTFAKKALAKRIDEAIATALQSQANALAEARQNSDIAFRAAIDSGEALENAQEELATMREALEPFAEAAASYDPEEGDDAQAAWAHDFTIGSLRRARRALGGSNAE